jgi:Fic family protein
MPTGYKWQPITDLPADPKTLTDGELESLHRVWVSQRKELVESGTLDEFEKRLGREWAIETGIVENVYTLDRGVTRTLIEKGIDAALIPHGASNRDSTLVARIIQDHYEALEGMFDFVGGTRQLSTGYIKELHAALLRNQETYAVIDQFGRAFEKPLEKGQYKIEPNGPTRPDGLVHEYCPPEQVASEMDRLVAMHAEHEAQNVPVEVEAAWFHHRFTQIHPFADGNGRVARAIASLVFIKADWFPLVVKRDDWVRYVEMLEQADQGELRPLVAMFVEAQRNALIQASEAAFEIKPISSTDQAIKAVRDRLMQRGNLPVKEWLKAKDTAGQLVESAAKRFEAIAQQLREEIGSLTGRFSFVTHSVATTTVDRAQKKALHEAGHISDLDEYNHVAWLSFHGGLADGLVLSFHALGPQYRGFIGVVAYLAFEGKEPLVLGTFQINYEEETASAEKRFSPWLEGMILEGLKQWRRTL